MGGRPFMHHFRRGRSFTASGAKPSALVNQEQPAQSVISSQLGNGNYEILALEVVSPHRSTSPISLGLSILCLSPPPLVGVGRSPPTPALPHKGGGRKAPRHPVRRRKSQVEA